MVHTLRLAALLLAAVPAVSLAQGAPARAQGGAADRSLQERVSDLKEKIFRTKARLMNLQEMVIGGTDASAGPKAVLVHRNDMGSKFQLESVSYALDGAPIYTKADVGGDLRRRAEFEIFNGRVAPGSHQLAVQLVYRGHGYGLFSYVDGYRFKVRSSYTFNAEAGKVSTIKVVGFERGGLTAALEERPAVRYDVDVEREDAARRGASPAAIDGVRR